VPAHISEKHERTLAFAITRRLVSKTGDCHLSCLTVAGKILATPNQREALEVRPCTREGLPPICVAACRRGFLGPHFSPLVAWGDRYCLCGTFPIPPVRGTAGVTGSPLTRQAGWCSDFPDRQCPALAARTNTKRKTKHTKFRVYSFSHSLVSCSQRGAL